MRKISIRQIVIAGVVAALYATLTIVIAPIAYGPIQFRIAEVLCILPFFFPLTVPGLFIGCLIANLLSPYGMLDVIAGSSATLLAALCTMWLGRLSRNSMPIKALACFPPVIFNAIIIGAVIAWFSSDGAAAFWPAFALYGFQVGFGQLVVMYALGFPLMLCLPRLQFFRLIAGRSPI